MAPQKLAQYVPQGLPTHGESRRQKTTARVGQIGIWRWCSTSPDTSDWVSKTAGLSYWTDVSIAPQSAP